MKILHAALALAPTVTAFTACMDSNGDTDFQDADSAVFAQAVSAVGVTLSSGTVGVAPNANLVLTFDQAIRPASVNRQNVRLYSMEKRTEVGAERTVLGVDASNRRVTINPVDTLRGEYWIEISGVVSSSGAPITARLSFVAQHNSAVKRVLSGQIETSTLDAKGRPVGVMLAVSDTGAFFRRYASTYRRGLDAVVHTDYFDTAGPDGKWGTADDHKGGGWDYVHDADGYKIGTIVYDEDGAISQYDKLRTVTPTLTDVYFFNGPGPDGTWLTGDDEIGSVMRRTFTSDGLLATLDFLVGAGDDNVWFTADDENLSHEETTYTATKITTRYTSPLFEDDGELYVDRLNADGTIARQDSSSDPGADQVFGTEDDVIDFITLSSYTYGGESLSRMFSSEGPDGRWETGDDVLASYERNDRVQSGASKRSAYVSEPGADGAWRTADDPARLLFDYDTTK